MNSFDYSITRAEMDILAERAYQRTIYNEAHDDNFINNELISSAIELLDSSVEVKGFSPIIRKKNPERRQQLIIAAALIAAEIDRLDRIEDVLLD